MFNIKSIIKTAIDKVINKVYDIPMSNGKPRPLEYMVTIKNTVKISESRNTGLSRLDIAYLIVHWARGPLNISSPIKVIRTYKPPYTNRYNNGYFIVRFTDQRLVAEIKKHEWVDDITVYKWL